VFRVTFYTSDGHRPSLTTSDPERTVEEQIRNWNSRGYWVQVPLIPEYPREYIVYRNGKRVASMTVKEIA
jgi:hypothetical protein